MRRGEGNGVMMMRWLLTSMVLGSAGGAMAAEDCSTFATQSEMNDCAGRNFEAADKQLNRVYREVVQRLADDSDGLGKLKAAERAWVAYRDAECSFIAMSVEGGSIYPTIWLGCRESMTADRTAALNGYLTCAEGDLGCPLPPP
jgi:uncharacterized protein YecT (DUF1311 family)